MRKQFVECMTVEEALDLCPWASETREATGGFWCFESVDDAELWDRTE